MSFEERKLIEEHFTKEEIEDAEHFFPEPPNYSQINGTKFGNHILNTIGWVWKNKKLVYNLSAPMQCGKTQTTLSAILRILKSEEYKNDNLYLIWYISTSDNGLLDKTRGDLLEFFRKNCEGEIEEDSSAIQIHRENGSLVEIRIIHNLTSQRVKDEIAGTFEQISYNSSIMKILVFLSQMIKVVLLMVI